jgi:hypothetical protein
MSFSTLRIRPAGLAALTLAVTIPMVAIVALKVNSQQNESNSSLQGKNQSKNEGSDDHNLPFRNMTVVPEANAGWVMVPFFGAVLLVSSRQFFRARANQKKAS